jgi:hypothetical protein
MDWILAYYAPLVINHPNECFKATASEDCPAAHCDWQSQGSYCSMRSDYVMDGGYYNGGMQITPSGKDVPIGTLMSNTAVSGAEEWSKNNMQACLVMKLATDQRCAIYMDHIGGFCMYWTLSGDSDWISARENFFAEASAHGVFEQYTYSSQLPTALTEDPIGAPRQEAIDYYNAMNDAALRQLRDPKTKEEVAKRNRRTNKEIKERRTSTRQKK